MEERPARPATEHRYRWALAALCLGVLMTVLNSTTVTVVLPSIREAFGLTDASAAWVVNAYLLPLSGFLMLAGRLGDLYGHRKLFLIGNAVFTAASLGCGWAPTHGILVLASAAQGLGGAL